MPRTSARSMLPPDLGKAPAPEPQPQAAPSMADSGIPRQLRPYLIGASIFPVVAALYLARGVLIPIALAGLLAFLLSPVVGALERGGLWRIRGGRVCAVMLVVVLVFSALGGAAWVVTQQVLALGSELPHYRGNLKRKIADIRGAGTHGALAEVQSAAKEVMGELQKNESAKGETKPLPVVVKAEAAGVWPIPKLLEALGGATFVIVLVIFMLIEQHEIRNRFIRVTGHGRLASVTRALDEAAERISRYLVAQTMINAAYGTALGAGLFFIGVPYAEEEACAQRGPVGRIDHGLGDEIAADAFRRLVQGSRHTGEPAVAGEPDEPIPYLVLLDEHEDHEDDNEGCPAQRFKKFRNRPDTSRLRLHHDGKRLRLALRAFVLL